MDTGSPSVTKILTMVLFALSVIGLTLFLWLSFGGTIPLTPRGYEFRVSFTNASQLADQADVRIAGVSVGKVIGKTLDPEHNRTMVTIQMNNKFAPIHKDAQAILRTKTIAGEIYVQLTPGHRRTARRSPDGGLLSRGQVANAVQLDQIFNALDPDHARGLPPVAAAARDRGQGQRPEPQQRARQPAHVRRRRLGPAQGARRPAHRRGQPGAQRRHRVRRAGPEPDGAAHADHQRRADVPDHRGQQQGDLGHLPRVPDLPGRDQGDDGAPAELRAGHRPAGQGARAGGHEPQADAHRRARAGARRCARSSSTSGR